MGLGTFLGRFFGRPDTAASRSAAKDRLRLVLMHDRTDIPATMMEAIRAEMMSVLSKYVEIDNDALDVQLERESGSIGLVLNIPIRRVKTEAEASEALAVMHTVQETGSPSNNDAPDATNAASQTQAVTSEAAESPPSAGLEPEANPAPPAPTAEDEAKISPLAAKNADKEDMPKTAAVRVGASVPIRALGHTKATAEPSTLEPAVAAPETSTSTAAENEPRSSVRDAWYSAELLHVVNTERQEISD